MNNNFVFFHKGDYTPTTTFTAFPCEHSEVYVSGLDRNKVYLEDTRGLRIYHDEQVFLCTDNTLFSVYTLEDNTYIEDIKIHWDTNCTLRTEPYLDESTKTTFRNTTTQKPPSRPVTTALNTEITVVTTRTTNTVILTEIEEVSDIMNKEIVTHKTLGEVPKNSFDSYYIHTFLIFFLTMALCIFLIHNLKKGEE